ncbi:MAG: hypothetical protein IJ067_02345 [Prevotella sp.]|nr:hypothetical protein [Prevotella sp.]
MREQRNNSEKEYKYQKQIDELKVLGCQMPTVFAPDNMSACRFAFSDDTHQNHIPQYMSNPKRMLQDIAKSKASMSLLALSCFDTPSKAETFYDNLKKAFKNISTSIGDALSEGTLTNDDGRKTMTANNGHFDFYEYAGCDLNSTFQITKQLTANEERKGI